MIFIGVDMASSDFQAWSKELGNSEVKNEMAEIRAWLKTLPKDAVIALESTGGYGTLLAELAHRSKRTVYLLAPRQIAAHRRSLGRRAKTDELDARLIAEFVSSNHEQLHPFEPWAEPWKQLRNAVRLRTRLARNRASIALRMRSFGCTTRQIASTTRGIKQMMLQLDREIETLVAAVPERKAVQSPCGVGPLTAAATIAVLKQIPFKDSDAFVAYMGLDLIVADSGKQRGTRRISSWGDVTLRSLYYMAGKTASNNEIWKPYVQKLTDRGMTKIQIHCAIGRRLARIVFRLYHSNEMFDPNKLLPKTKNAPPMLAKQT